MRYRPIIGQRRGSGGWQYLARWVGYGAEDDEWLPRCELDDFEALDRRFAEHGEPYRPFPFSSTLPFPSSPFSLLTFPLHQPQLTPHITRPGHAHDFLSILITHHVFLVFPVSISPHPLSFYIMPGGM